MEGRVREDDDKDDDEDFDGVENDGDALRKRAGGRHGGRRFARKICKESKAVRRTRESGKRGESVFDSKEIDGGRRDDHRGVQRV